MKDCPTVSGFHIYGRSAGLKIEADMTSGKFPTVAIEAAHGTPGQAYAWDQKVRFQFAQRELPTLLAVLLGLRPLAEFLYHGEQRDKALQIIRTPDGPVLRLRGRNKLGELAKFSVLISLEGTFQFLALALQQLAAGYGLSQEVALALVKAAADNPVSASETNPVE